MSSKTGGESWSMVGRMAAWYAGSASVLLLVATTGLYLTIAANLDAQGDEYLAFSVDYIAKYEARTGRAPGPEDWPADCVRVRDADGRVVLGSPAADERLPRAMVPGSSGVDFHTGNGRRFRALSRRVGERLYEVSYDRTREFEMLRTYRYSMAFVLVPALAASAVAGVAIARKGLRPVGEIAATARRIGPECLGERIASDGLPAELGDLARTFNVMLDRLQNSFSRLERFSGDIAHELRTPVHSIRNVAEVALATSRTREDDRESLAACLDSAEQLSRLIDRLLFLARAEDPRTALVLEHLDLATVLATVGEFYEPAATEAGIELVVMATPGLSCAIDRTLFQRALGNLLTNALSHTPSGGRVIVSASREAAGVVVSVADTGRGIAAEHLPRLFDRFYRLDTARSPGQGVGLGLAIVKGIAELHRGRASIASRPGEGCTVTLHLPDARDDGPVISP